MSVSSYLKAESSWKINPIGQLCLEDQNRLHSLDKHKKKKSPYRYIPREWMISTRKLPYLRRLWLSPAGKYRGRKAVAGFVFGGLIAYVIGSALIGRMPLHPETSAYLKWSTFVIFAAINAMSSQGRCLTLLLISTIMSKSGALFLKSVIMALVIAGPVENLLLNAKGVVNSITCTNELVKNLTLTKYKLTSVPYQQALMNLKVDVTEVMDTMGSIKEVITPLMTEILDDTEIKYLKEENDYIDDLLKHTRRSKEIDTRYPDKLKRNKTSAGSFNYYQKFDINLEMNGITLNDLTKSGAETDWVKEEELGAAIEDFYLKKLEYRCNNMITGTIKKCRRTFADTYELCCSQMRVHVAWLLCWPLKVSAICNVVSILGTDQACDPSKVLSRGWGVGMVTLLKMKEALSQSFRSPEVVYRVQKPEIHVDADRLLEQAGDLKLNFDDNSRWYRKFMNLVQVGMNLIFLKVIYDAIDYRQKYLTNIEFENVYVSRYFMKIDARRCSYGKHTLLPFKNREKRGFIFPTRYALQSTEIETAGYGLMCLLPLFFFITAIVLIDRAFAEALDIVSRNARIEFVSTGYQGMKLIVKGSGMVAKIVRSVVDGFNTRRNSNETHNNDECLPKPTYLKNTTLFGMYGVLLMCAAFLVMDGYGSRLKWGICEFFYPKRAKKRTLFLYNDTLKKRKVFFKYMNTKVKRLIRENKLDQDTSTLLLLSMKYPKYFGWLSIFFVQARRKCLVCRELEDLGFFRNNRVMFECQNCLYVYCKECYYDIGQRCHRCRPLSIDEDSDPDSVLAKSERSD